MVPPMRILSGVQPSGKLHLGNYFGAIRQFVDLQDKGEGLYFIADMHALTSISDGAKLRAFTIDVALDFLALGLDPTRAILFKQSDLPEVTELAWILSNVTPMGLLERATSYKDKVARGIAANHGLFAYPVLMAADILLYGTDRVPVGKDQSQHLEMTRDMAAKFNQAFVPGYDPQDPEGAKTGVRGILKLPEPYITADAAVVPGVDGRKMSKSYGNAIEMFMDDAPLKKRIMGIQTDSSPVEAPKDPDATPIFALLKLFASPDELAEHERTFREGGVGYGKYKQRLLELFHEKLDPARARRKQLEGDLGEVERILRDGANRARELAMPILTAVRKATGLS
jgi:tryptophanyl-tRNA synthetase